jgi:predicted dehydrogenase
MPPKESNDRAVSRREFVTTAAATAAAFMIVPRHVLGRGFQAPSDLVNVAAVGINGQGAINTRAVMSQNIVAICDCDFALLEGRLQAWRTAAARMAVPAGQDPNAGVQGGRGQGAGGQAGAGAGRAGGPPPSPWRDFERSKAQLTADARWPAENANTTLQRFVNEQMPRLQKYQDYREMLEKQKDIDAVIIATPDHMHAPIASAAMDLGKHVYVQKPLCWSVNEARHLAKKAAEKKVVALMGNQNHSRDNVRRAVELIQSGAIGDVREVHVWTNRPLGYWPQGIPRPAALTGDPARLPWNNQAVTRRLAAAMNGTYPVPEQLSWDLFLGCAPAVDYHPLYHPFNWRGWVDWGQGALGDMGAHLMDFPHWSLKLGLPTSIQTVSTPFNDVCYPTATTTHYEFPARRGFPEVRLTWYDGGFMPPDPNELGDERLDPNGGILYVGSKGKMLQQPYAPRLLPMTRHNSFKAPKDRLPRVPHEDHEMNWINAIKGRDQLSCSFEDATRLTEIMLLGIVSLRARNAKLAYDAANMRITNNVAANQYLTREYRAGFGL